VYRERAPAVGFESLSEKAEGRSTNSGRPNSLPMTLGRPLVSPRFAGCDVPVDRRQWHRAPAWARQDSQLARVRDDLACELITGAIYAYYHMPIILDVRSKRCSTSYRPIRTLESLLLTRTPFVFDCSGLCGGRLGAGWFQPASLASRPFRDRLRSMGQAARGITVPMSDNRRN
jgi:hypothetical protein